MFFTCLSQINRCTSLRFRQKNLCTVLAFRQDYLFNCLRQINRCTSLRFRQNNLCTYLTFKQDYLFLCHRQNNLCTSLTFRQDYLFSIISVLASSLGPIISILIFRQNIPCTRLIFRQNYPPVAFLLQKLSLYTYFDFEQNNRCTCLTYAKSYSQCQEYKPSAKYNKSAKTGLFVVQTV